MTRRALGYRHANRDQGGFWLADFSLQGPSAELAQWFYERLGFHFEEWSGGVLSWEGMIYEMALTVGGTTRVRSLDKLFDHVRTTYIDNNNVVQTSAAAEIQASQDRYGRREEILFLDGYTQQAAEARRDRHLAEFGWPTARTAGVLSGQAEQLEVQICGYGFTGNWRYESAGDGTTDNLSDWVGEIIAADCEFLQVGSVAANTYQVKKETPTPQRAWDVLKELAKLGDAGESLYRLYVGQGRRVTYEAISTTPRYYLRKGKLYGSAGGSVEVDPWQVQPGVVRDLDYPISKRAYQGWLEDERDFYVHEVEVLSDGSVALKTDEFEEGEILANQQEYELRQRAGAATQVLPKGGNRHVYEHMGIKRKDWVLMSREEKLAIKMAWWQKRKARRGGRR